MMTTTIMKMMIRKTAAMMMMPMDHLVPVHAGRTITIVHKDNNDNDDDQKDVYNDDDDANGSPGACTCREDNYNCS